jgi:hypothetical protein
MPTRTVSSSAAAIGTIMWAGGANLDVVIGHSSIACKTGQNNESDKSYINTVNAPY